MSRLQGVIIWVGRSGRRIAVTAVGVTLLLAGLAMLVLPGPGILGTLAGLAVLGTEYAWARRALERTRDKAKDVRNGIRLRKAS